MAVKYIYKVKFLKIKSIIVENIVDSPTYNGPTIGRRRSLCLVVLKFFVRFTIKFIARSQLGSP